MSDHIYKRHNKSLLLYHLVCPIKYRRSILTEEVSKCVVQTCSEIEFRYDIYFVEVGLDENHVHFLVQSVPMYSPKQIVQTVKSIIAREVFRFHPEVKEQLWGGQFWSDGYYVNTVDQYANEEVIIAYLKNQGKQKEYKQIHSSQLRLFE
ncbi:IS200/IS605 family transposase [Sabulilitoribacter arenilitoris]|uniref:IS200/IS605 family transposase n=1 Tax=Wocania arenilitoris TaxID=2044858 RepID=A0AAE3JLM0_9FLAO|nr:IS200/IS605 family transposase [Wocania arenilitoris]MCF7569408.1 IS200/IS605 family transposase [Wocania arenilitoris]